MKDRLKVQYCSDLHLEFTKNKFFLEQNPLQIAGDVLILAGDVVPYKVMHKNMDFFNSLSGLFQQVWWIPGNHEYYRSDISRRSGSFKENITGNLVLLNNKSVEYQDVTFIFTTLWSKISPGREWMIEENMNDFHIIRYGQERFSAAMYNKLHEESMEFLREELSKTRPGPLVVVSHHVPTFYHYPEQYKNSFLNEAFAVELFDLIESSSIDYWIYGHHHQNREEILIGKTRLLTNQLGYVHLGEHLSFELSKTFEV